MLEVRSLCQTRGDAEVLKDISFSVKRSETFVVIGPTGSGKTTLLRLLGLLERPASGTFRLGGREVPDSNGARLELRRRIAMVLQRPAVFNSSVYDNVAYGLHIRKQDGASLHRKVEAALETVGLSAHSTRNARTLSGGEVQRVALARAMVVEPDLLLLDEPTANLDPVSTSNVEKLISGIIQEMDTTVVMATHDMFQGQRLADRMGVIVAGEMQQTGDPRDVFGLPQSREIAELVGMENILEGSVSSNDSGVVAIGINGTQIQAISSLQPGEPVYACIRADEIILALRSDKTSARNAFAGNITRVIPFGPLAHVHMDCGFPLISLITAKSAQEMGLRTGSPVHASFKATGVHIIPRQ
jgi:tungstate transport system ATP-binding protein